MIEFRYGELTTDGLTSRNRAEVHAALDADLVLAEDGRELYSEVQFPVVQVLAALREWQRDRGVFEFWEPSFVRDRWGVRFRPVGDGWQLVNDDEDPVVTSSVLATADLDAAIDDFGARLRVSCVARLGEWITEFV
ncbi:hypothetical protein [Kutzneria sp. CA-103260]|uniref:hypothetical protein n=1 Tax=Kutzneria sp. CA-103260 TaxID=2802641 RepID=UPI001BA8D3A9|nr:hypothetical protein [Kutzneria sp. CA-103260]QUQ66188.1 hypothetical protein JJ691_39140 [Kutzneria sp. CA-103260]